MKKDRDWTVLFIGGASGTGKSSIAQALARHYEVNVMEIDDIGQALRAMAGKDIFPALHYWSTGVNWMDIGIDGNLDWLIRVSKEIAPALKAVADNHLESDVPVIIEGDFLYPEFAISLDNPRVKTCFVAETDTNQIVQNYLDREGGDTQAYRAAISVAYGDWLSGRCGALGIPVVESRPWNTAVDRVTARL